MNKPLPIYLRAHTVALKNKKSNERKFTREKQPKWPDYVLIIDCETTTDVSQTLTFGVARFCELRPKRKYQCTQEIIFYADDLPERNPAGVQILLEYARDHEPETIDGDDEMKVVSRSEFIEEYFWWTLLHTEGMVVCFNAPFDLSRLAIDCREARKKDEGWSLVMSLDTDPDTGLVRENPFRPRVKIIPINSKSAIIKLTGVGIKSKNSGERLKPYTPGRFLDLKTLGWGIRNKPFSLNSACRHFGVEGKSDHEPTGIISFEEIDYCRQDVRATNALLDAMRADFDLHSIDLKPDEVVSPASIAKAYLRKMGIMSPSQKFKIPDWVNGIAMQSYYGGQSECRIRHAEMPIVLTDLMSEYSTANVLLGLWKMLTAEHLRVDEATAEIEAMLATFSPENIFNKEYWPQLCFFALVQPSGDIFPARTTYNGHNTNIGVNPITSDKPIWYAGPDIIASTLRTGRVPKILRAIRVLPEGQQKRMKSVRLRGKVEIDPTKQDLFQSVIEARGAVKNDKKLSKEEQNAHAYFLKILGSSGSYGLFVQVNPKAACKGERQPLNVFSGDAQFQTTSEVREKPGPWYFPIFGSLITAAGRLMLALIEYSINKRGGSYLFCDTDSMAIVASENGGLIACPGGNFQLADGRAAVKALRFKEVREIQAEIDTINPYDRNLVKDAILKIEDVNFKDGVQRQIFGNSTAAKRYVLYSKTGETIGIVSAKAHGLGFLYPPKPGFNEDVDAPDWVVEGWTWILAKLRGEDPERPTWFDLPAMMRCTITTREVLKALQASQAKIPYPNRAGKPFNFVMLPLLDDVDGYPADVVDRVRFTLITPFESDPSRWFDATYLNVHDPNLGKANATKYRLGRSGSRLASEAVPKTCGDFIERYPWQRESKSNGPDGNPSGPRTQGLLTRIPVVVRNFGYIGKETDRRWEQGEDISLLDGKVIEYRPNETEKLAIDEELAHEIRRVSIRKLAKAAGVSENTIKAARRGKRIQKRLIIRLKEGSTQL